MAIVADFESYPQWNEEVTGAWVLARYDDGRPSQLRLDTKVQGMDGTYIQAVTDYHNIIYFKDASSLYVNLFLPSEVIWTRAK